MAARLEEAQVGGLGEAEGFVHPGSPFTWGQSPQDSLRGPGKGPAEPLRGGGLGSGIHMGL